MTRTIFLLNLILFYFLFAYIFGGTKFKTGSIELELSICLRDRLGESAERVEEDSAYKLKLLLFIETLWREGLDVSLGRLIINNLKKKY